MSINTSTSTSLAKPSVIIVYGPTGVGKTDFALKIAECLPVEIINMDVGQLYTPLSIGTAKPDMRTVPVAHHGFNVLSEPEHFTVVAYRTLCEQLIKDIWSRGKVPVLVGGSGFYLKSLFFPPLSAENEKDVDDAGNIAVGREKEEQLLSMCTTLYDREKEEQLLSMRAILYNKVYNEDNENEDSDYLWRSLHAIDPVRALELRTA